MKNHGSLKNFLNQLTEGSLSLKNKILLELEQFEIADMENLYIDDPVTYDV